MSYLNVILQDLPTLLSTWVTSIPVCFGVLIIQSTICCKCCGEFIGRLFCSRSNRNTVVWHLKLSDFLSDGTIRFISYFLILCYLCLLFDIMLIVLISGVFYLKLYCLGMVKNVRKKLQYNFKRWLLLKGEQFSRF